ncbi:crossover junction endodeoxyribonuclease RuvC [Taibaiella helva]|uniref:crossover junction endodeoxyribonuclease RuvC n=1 Tax=Taibaiella helva TaxID=2301235 RepID=UPI001E3AA576|nr:crossover junction endodeoxyribonuclease RuvC [Taibaiella helva]
MPIILGIDPGTLLMGYGIISADKSNLSLVEMGVLHLSKYKDHSERLHFIFERVSALVQIHRPGIVALEAPFFGKNVQSMLKLGRAQGVAMAAAMAHGSTTVEYAPRKIKQVITGNGNASKEQVWKMLQHQLGFKEDPGFLDATDAVAAALCHHFECRMDTGKGISRSSSHKPAKGWAAFVEANPGRVRDKE